VFCSTKGKTVEGDLIKKKIGGPARYWEMEKDSAKGKKGGVIFPCDGERGTEK